MELMEEGNLMDRVQILLQRDLAYYEEHQTVLQENLCLGAVGGPFDFPRYASFAAVKLVQWWEEEFVACFHHPSGLVEGSSWGTGGEGAKRLPPTEFVAMVQQSAEKLLEHVHTLSQEALDHADLTVLTATLGAAALTKNALHCFNEVLKKETKGLSLHQTSRLMQEMVEALAERLLDLHCRLLALYVLQDVDSLHWESQHAFLEGQRGSFTVQMWWFYMQGAREDLWTTVPPKIAQRVLAGMLNETLTILAARYSQARPSIARSPQLVTDIANILVCVRYLLPSICSSGSDFLGLIGPGSSKAVRDVHAKCHDLLCTLLCRGCPLGTLYKVFRKGTTSVSIFNPRPMAPCTWLVLVAPQMFPPGSWPQGNMRSLADRTAVAVELSVLVAQPEACWPLLLKVLLMRSGLAARLVLRQLLCQMQEQRRSQQEHQDSEQPESESCCGGFLCGATAGCWVEGSVLHPHQVLSALILTLVVVCGEPEGGGPHALATVLAPLLHRDSAADWDCLDRRQMWAEKRRPAWLAALVGLARGCLRDAIHGTDSITSLLEAILHVADTLPLGLIMTARLLDDVLPADVHPLGGYTLMQVLGAAAYSELIERHEDALAEHWCNMQTSSGIHTSNMQATNNQAVIDKILSASYDLVREAEEELEDKKRQQPIEEVTQVADVLVSSLLLTPSGRIAVKVLYKFVLHAVPWLLGELGSGEVTPAPITVSSLQLRPPPPPLLHAMFHVGSRTFDEVLRGIWQPDWNALLHASLNVSRDHLTQQLQRRAEFREPHFLSKHDSTVVHTLSSILLSTADKKTLSVSSPTYLAAPQSL